MNNREQEIKKLKTKRFNLREKIRTYVKQDKDAYDLVLEYVNIVEQMQRLGSDVRSMVDYLLVNNWEEGGKYYHLRQNKNRTSRGTIENKQPVQSRKEESMKPSSMDTYTLCLAWVSETQIEPSQVKKVKTYFEELGLPQLDKSQNIGANGLTETVLKYEFAGSEDSFRLLKVCTQFVLDAFAQSDFDRFNIAVWGKKMPK